jgi:8-oxo-dGTP pyrophosphatase MutT (NUDIX family)
MNKKIYFNDRVISFGKEETQDSENQFINVYKNVNEENITEIIYDFLGNSLSQSTKIVTENFENLFDVIKKSFLYIEAAGGLIEKENQFLFIHRLGKWDLPKGKLEKKESPEAAAIRECEEECGVNDLIIIKPLPSTFHIYNYKNAYALKQTYWFYMQTTYPGELKPQLEENIDEVEWFNIADIESLVFKNSYSTIVDLVRATLNF